MADVTIRYKGNTIAEMNEGGSKTLKTSGKYCEGDIGIEYVKSSGGASKPEVWEGVNFIDYDGTVIETWTSEEVANKTELPTPPTHDEFVDAGWNWELDQIKTYIGENPQACIYVGAEYNVKNNDTVIFINLADNTQLSPMIVLGLSGTVTIDWGDGTTTDVTGTSLSTAIPTTHTYGAIGNYKIRISGKRMIAFFYNNTTYNGGSVFCGNQYYKNCVKEIWLGNVHNDKWNNILCRFPSMERVLISKGYVGELPSSFMDYTNNLKCLVLHKRIMAASSLTDGNTNRVSYNPFLLNSIEYSNSYNGCVYLPYKYYGTDIKISNYSEALFRKVIIPDNEYVTKISSYFMSGCGYVSSLVIPEHITKIETYAFNNCKSLQEIHFKSATPPTVTNSDAFNGIPTTCKIYVPKDVLTDYRQATNYPDPSVYTYTYIEE